MDIKEFLSVDNIAIGLSATDKASVLRELSRRAAIALKLSIADVTNEIERRDQLGSTGIGDGVSLPHARMHDVKGPFGIMARLKTPIAFDAIDEQPVDLVFLLLLPTSPQLDQLNVLAAVARKLRAPQIRQRLREATDVASLHRVVTI
jgi:PTS system nitrogen regulatory IIA component